LKRNNWECKGILIGPLMAPRFFRPPRFRHCVFHSLSKSRSRLRAQISRRGWQADVTSSRVCQTGTPGPAGASFERNFFDFVETSQGPDVNRTTSTVTALERSRWRGGRFACYAQHVMPQGGAFNCDFRFSLILLSHAKSIDCRRKRIQFP